MPGTPWTQNDFIAVCAIGWMVVAAIYLVLGGRAQTPQQRIVAVGLFACGAALLVYSFLFERPDIIDSLRENIALALIGLAIATIGIIKIAMSR